ncbi:MAG TPA: histidine triad (HIT) protein, partial [Spirochaetaceae bacterium]|nr:histidine triad (HIT) protein [Spirochaetaceae bacterium]
MDYFFNFDKLDYLRGEKPEGCILCLVAADDPAVPCLVVFQNELAIVSLNLYPYNPGHLIVFPRRHVVDLRQVTAG